MPLGPSAAAAVEIALKPVSFTTDSLGEYAHWDTPSYDIVTTGTPGEELWARVRLQDAGVRWDASQIFVSNVGAQFGTYSLDVYTSSDPAEDGSTIASLSSTGPANFGSLTITADIAPTYWVYIRIQDSGTGDVDRGTLRFLAKHTQRVEFVVSGNHGQASIPHGSTRVGIQGPNNVRGRTKVEVVILATDSITDAPDLHVLTATDGVLIRPPLTAETGEPALAWVVAPSITWSKTAWAKLDVPAGTYRFFHNAEVADILIGGLGGSALGIYTGPPNASYPDLTLIAGADLITDPTTGAVLAADETVTIATPTWLYLQSAYAGTFDAGGLDATGAAPFHMSWESLTPPAPAPPDPVVGSTRVLIVPGLLRVNGFTTVRASAGVLPPVAVGTPDQVYGTTTVEITAPVVVQGIPDPVVGSTTVAFLVTPDLSDNPPITYALEFTGDMIAVPAVPEAFPDVLSRKTQPLTVLTMPTPILVAGRPVVPRNLGVIDSTSTGHQGAGHIRAMPPAPVWDGSGYVNPPPLTTKPWVGRWVVDDLPDPPTDGFYWLGAPSAADGTAGIAASKRQWSPHGSTPHAPSWRSIYPFKPSVRAVDSFLPGGNIVHHPKGVHFNRQFIEHMWMDWGGPRRQPFTWVIACILASFPTTHYEHYVLDAGRDPDAVGFPRLADFQTSTPRTIDDGLAYRNLLSYSPHYARICARPNEQGPRTARVRSHGASRAPRMLYGVYNAGHSVVGDYSPSGPHHANGTIDNTSAQHHRYYVLGRANGHMSQDKASHVLVFEIRFWDYALTAKELAEQYDQLSSTYHFNRYRSA